MSVSPPVSPQPSTTSDSSRRPRLLLQAYCFDPMGTMEERNGWQRAVMATQTCHVTAMYLPTVPMEELERRAAKVCPANSITFVPVEDDWWSQKLKANEWSFYAGYRRWHKLAYLRARKLHASHAFDLTHLVTLCGFREPGYLWQLDAPFVWGPIGGTHNFPSGYFQAIDWVNRMRERFRSAINNYQLHRCPRVHRVAKRATHILAATENARKDLEKGLQVPIDSDLETGLEYPLEAPRQARDPSQPLRILWAGRLRPWKGFPILLHAMAKLPKDIKLQVRVLGDGNCKSTWQRLSKQLGVSGSIEWIAWPTYQQTLPHYAWADLFAFTSLRDTSGTGLLESLAAGTPILGMDHQGAMDIMSDDSCIRVPVTGWQESIAGFASGIEWAARNPDEWLVLSRNATRRASNFHWNSRSNRMLSIYNEVLNRKPVQATQEEKWQDPNLIPLKASNVSARSAIARPCPEVHPTAFNPTNPSS